MDTKTCVTCSNAFVPSSRHKSCPACRREARKHLCSVCNKVLIGASYKKCIKCNNGTGSSNPAWKGGKSVNKKGYILIYQPDHPRASANNSYVFEHILVMEQTLGRYLKSNENVHHKNGIRTENMSTNLELWTRHQPSGQRSKDLLAWAIEFIVQYENDISILPTSLPVRSPEVIKTVLVPLPMQHNVAADAPRRLNHDNYVYVKYVDHPRSRKQIGYRIFEHILVMENMLGRYMLPGEQVHHRNGVRDDNRPENLELWVKQQPSGQRVTDLYVWACEVRYRYALAA